MKNQNNNPANFSNQNDSLTWLKIDGYKSNSIQPKSVEHDNLMWLKVNGYKHSQSQSGMTSFSSVGVFFRALLLL